MVMQPWLVRVLHSTRTWIALGILAPLGMLFVSGLMLLDMRRDAWDKADQTSRNLLQVIERDIARNIEIIDLSLRATVDNLKVSSDSRNWALPRLWCSRAASHGAARIVNIRAGLHI